MATSLWSAVRNMVPALKELLTNLIDYAGLFPPAQLPLDRALRLYAEYRKSPDAWMLGRFIIQAARLPELTPFAAELFTEPQPFTISALGRGGKDKTEFLAGLAADLDAIRAFVSQHGSKVVVDAFEVRVPSADVVADAVALIREKAPAPLTPSFEDALGANWRENIAALAQAVNAAATKAGGNCGVPQFKLRCGGVEAAAFPSPEQIAYAIAQCRASKVPLKCTAGLHHPIRHYNETVKTKMHGFINVFAAGLFAQTNTANEAALRAILEDESAGNFRFDTAGMHWKELSVSVGDIHRGRGHVTSYGSCSFDEPRDDLRALKWL